MITPYNNILIMCTNCYRYITEIDIDHRAHSDTSRAPSVSRPSRDRDEVSGVLWRHSDESAHRRQPTTVFVQASLSGTLLPPYPFNVTCLCDRVWSKFQTLAIVVDIGILYYVVYNMCILYCECRRLEASTAGYPPAKC